MFGRTHSKSSRNHRFPPYDDNWILFALVDTQRNNRYPGRLLTAISPVFANVDRVTLRACRVFPSRNPPFLLIRLN